MDIRRGVNAREAAHMRELYTCPRVPLVRFGVQKALNIIDMLHSRSFFNALILQLATCVCLAFHPMHGVRRLTHRCLAVLFRCYVCCRALLFVFRRRW